METQWVLTRITKDKKAFIVGCPSIYIQAIQRAKTEVKSLYPNQLWLVRDLKAFKQTPIPKKYL